MSVRRRSRRTAIIAVSGGRKAPAPRRTSAISGQEVAAIATIAEKVVEKTVPTDDGSGNTSSESEAEVGSGSQADSQISGPNLRSRKSKGKIKKRKQNKSARERAAQERATKEAKATSAARHQLWP